jgi:hypothetical protein
MTKCEWINPKLEAYFTDELAGEELHRVQDHLAACAECRRQVDSFNEIDSMVRGVFQRRVALAQHAAQTPARPRVLRVAMAGAGLAVAAFLLVIGMKFFEQTPAPPTAVNPPSVPDVQPGIKKDDVGERRLAKPDEAVPPGTVVEPAVEHIGSDAPDFVITDPAGYTTTLETYRGRALLFGVVSPDQQKAVAGLQKMYDSFGRNGGIRIVGVSRQREENFDKATFPVLFNHGSKLMGVADGHFLLLDSTGNPRLEGSLTDAQGIAKVRTQLEQLGVQ